MFQWAINDVNALFLVHPDGTGLHQLPGTESPASGAASHPEWSADGTSVAYLWHTGRDPDNIEIRAVSVDGATVTTVVPCAVASCMQADGPAYSHDGKSLAFGEADNLPGGGAQISIVVMNLADGTRTVVARSPLDGSFKELGRPRWSADDKSLAFFVATWPPGDADTPDATEIAIAPVDGSAVDELRIVAGLPDFASYPDWSPVADSLIFDTYDEAWFYGRPSTIYSVNRDGSALQPLTPASSVAVHPTYSADGTEIFYTTFGDDGWPRLSFMSADGTGRVVLDVKGMHPRLQPLK